MGRAGVGVDFGHGEAFTVFGQVARAHEATVEVDVFRVAYVAGLYRFLGDDAIALAHHLARQPGGAVAFSGIGVDAADEVNHRFSFFRMR